MIIDTSYLLPLARIEIDNDFLLAIAEKRGSSNQLSFDRIRINSISIFELQAKAAKLRVKLAYVLDAIEQISKSFRIESYYSPDIIKTAFELRETMFSDYIDCIIVATAIELKDELVTEDSRIIRKKEALKEEYELLVFTSRELLSR